MLNFVKRLDPFITLGAIAIGAVFGFIIAAMATHGDREIGTIGYIVVKERVEEHPSIKPFVEEQLNDGIITYDEYYEIIKAHNRARVETILDDMRKQ